MGSDALKVILWLLAEAGPEKVVYLPGQASLHNTSYHSAFNWPLSGYQILFLSSIGVTWAANIASTVQRAEEVIQAQFAPMTCLCPSCSLGLKSSFIPTLLPDHLWEWTAGTFFWIPPDKMKYCFLCANALCSVSSIVCCLCFPSSSPLCRRLLEGGWALHSLLHHRCPALDRLREC